jgi:hypothetical protein
MTFHPCRRTRVNSNNARNADSSKEPDGAPATCPFCLQVRHSHTAKQVGERLLQPFGNFRYSPVRRFSPAPDSAVVRSTQPAPPQLLLIDICSSRMRRIARPKRMDIERHRLPSSRYAADAYTPYESHLY